MRLDLASRTTFGPYTLVERLTDEVYLVRCRCGREYTRTAKTLGACIRLDVRGCRKCSPGLCTKVEKTRRNARVVEAAGRGLSLAELADKFGITRQRVYQILQRGTKG